MLNIDKIISVIHWLAKTHHKLHLFFNKILESKIGL